MEEAPEHSKELLHSARANGTNECMHEGILCICVFVYVCMCTCIWMYNWYN